VRTDVEVVRQGKDGELSVKPQPRNARARAMWGTTRANSPEHGQGRDDGLRKDLELVGVGYRAAMKGKNLRCSSATQPRVIYKAPAGITFASAKPTEIKISGIDKQAVGQVAAEIRSFRPPEPYKGKGVR
jgi:large subunit ribosomal protein L6